jgi:4-methylaminobutanoate oxidase (formaldehyde-forming)
VAEQGPAKRLVCITIDDLRQVVLGNEPVVVHGETVGRVTTGGVGYTIGKSVAFAYVPPEQAEPGTKVTILVFGTWVEGVITPEPLFDPKAARVKA